MTPPPRKAPHCKTCHMPLKGHRRGVCETASLPTPPPDATPPRRANTKKPSKGGAYKSAPLPLEMLPTLSPQSSEILNNLLRANSHSAPRPIQVPSPTGNKRVLRSASAGRDAESLHVALEGLSASDKKESKTPFARAYSPTEVDGHEEKDPEPHAATPQPSAAAVSRQLGLQTLSEAPTLAPRTTSSAAVSQQLQASVSDLTCADMTIQNFLDSTAQSSHHPPAMIFSFPADAVPALEDGAQSLGLFVHALPTLSVANDGWVPVVVGRDRGAVAKLLEDSEKLAQDVQKSGGSSAGEFRVGMSHIVAGSLGALATWAGLAYS